MKDDIKQQLDAIKIMVAQLHKLSFGSLKNETEVKLRHKFRGQILSSTKRNPRGDT